MSSFGSASLGNQDTVDSGTTIIDPSGTGPTNPVNKDYVDTANQVQDARITTVETDLDGFPDELKNLDQAEINQLENIGTNTIDNTQWGYVGGLDQALSSGSSVVFNNVATDSIEIKSGTLGEDVVFQTTDPENTFRINKQGDLRYYNDSNIRTFGQNKSSLTGYDVDGDQSWSWFYDTPGLNSDTIFQSTSKNGSYVPYQINRNGDTFVKNSNDIFVLSTGAGNITGFDNTGDEVYRLFQNGVNGNSDTVKQVFSTTGNATYDLSRNGTIILREQGGTERFRLDTQSGRFTAGDIFVGSGSEINSTGLAVKSATSGLNNLLNVVSSGSEFRDDSGNLLASVNSAGITVPNNLDIFVDGVDSIKSLSIGFTNNSNGIATNATNISNNATNISNNASSIGTNATNISNNTSALLNKVDGNVGVQRLVAGNIATYSNLSEGVLVTSGLNSTENDFNLVGSKQVVIEGGVGNTPMVFNGTDNVVVGEFTTNRTVGNNNVYIGYGISANNQDNNVVIGNNLDGTSSGNTNTVIGSNNSFFGSEHVLFGFNNDILGGIRNILFGTSSTIGSGSNQVIAMGSQSSSTGQQLTTMGIGVTNFGSKNVVVGNNNTAATVGATAVNNVIQLGNNLTSRADDNLTVGDNIVVTSAGIYFQQVFETISGGGSDVVFESLAGGVSKLGSIISSRRHKEEIVNLEESEFNSEDIYKVIPKRFKYKEKKGHHVGVIAEDYLDMDSSLLKNLVVWGEEPNVPESEPRNEAGMTVKSFNYRGLIVPMVAEMKKLKFDIEQLKKQNKAILELLKNQS